MYLLSRDDISSEHNESDVDEPTAELDRTSPSTAEGSLIAGCCNFIIIVYTITKQHWNWGSQRFQ